MEQKRNKKRSFYLFVIFVVVFVILYGVFAWIGDRIAIKNLTERKDFKSARDYENYMRILDQAYKNDNYGSTTPEGTLEMFVDALKKGDTDLAAKYFVPEKQKKMAEDLKVGMKSGGVKMLIGDMEKEKTKFEMSSTTTKFQTYDDDNRAEFSFDLRLNKFTQKWKIESL